MGKIQKIYHLHFPKFKILFTHTQVEDLTEEGRQEPEILKQHKRAHRKAQEKKTQLLQKIYSPHMNAKTGSLVKQCKICKENKYDCYPNKPQ